MVGVIETNNRLPAGVCTSNFDGVLYGLGAVFVEALRGSYSGVMGLPLFETAALLQVAGLPIMANSVSPHSV